MGFRKRLRKALRAAYSRDNGRYPDGPLDPMTLKRTTGSLIGLGMEREADRIARIRKMNAKIREIENDTRQQRRAQERVALKERRSRFKKAMMDKRLPGGSAVIR